MLKNDLENTLGYIIVGTTNNSNEVKFYAIDRDSGGYPYWSSFVLSAKLFSTKQEAIKILFRSDFVEEKKYSDGEIFPPQMIHSGADICNTKTKGVLQIQILPLTFGESVHTRIFIGEIKKPKGFVY